MAIQEEERIWTTDLEEPEMVFICECLDPKEVGGKKPVIIDPLFKEMEETCH